MKDLPNMGESDRGKASDAAPKPQTSIPAVIPAVQAVAPPKPNTLLNNVPVARSPRAKEVPLGWAAGWKKTLYEKWRWAALIALAVVVSRLSS